MALCQNRKTDLLVGKSNISLESTGDYVSGFNGNDECHKIIIQNMLRADLIGINKHTNKWC